MKRRDISFAECAPALCEKPTMTLNLVILTLAAGKANWLTAQNMYGATKTIKTKKKIDTSPTYRLLSMTSQVRSHA